MSCLSIGMPALSDNSQLKYQTSIVTDNLDFYCEKLLPLGRRQITTSKIHLYLQSDQPSDQESMTLNS